MTGAWMLLGVGWVCWLLGLVATANDQPSGLYWGFAVAFFLTSPVVGFVVSRWER